MGDLEGSIKLGLATSPYTYKDGYRSPLDPHGNFRFKTPIVTPKKIK
jgi:hypothetical protein